MLITLQKTNISDVVTWYFIETTIAAYRITNYSLPRNLNLVVDDWIRSVSRECHYERRDP